MVASRRPAEARAREAPPPRRPVLFLNPASGGGRAERVGLADRAAARGIEVIVLGPGVDLAGALAVAVEGGADALGVAGGDGTLATVAAAALEHGLPFVCVPAGTRNHFALDLGLDRGDLVAALDAFGDAIERSVDVGEVNGRVFLNNVSIGVYGEAVRDPGYRDAKARTLFETATRVLGPGAVADDVELVDDRGTVHRGPAVVLVSNNPYAVEAGRVPGTRARLDGGELGVLVLDGPAALLSPPYAWTTQGLDVSAPAPVHTGIDGEAVELTPPLRFATRPGALRVRVARRSGRS